MKKLLLAGAALTALFGGTAVAADMRAQPAYAPPPPPVYSWTGLYWGANIGYSWGETETDRSLFGGLTTVTESSDIDGIIGGGQSGYNYQFGSWVWGFETDIQASGQKGGSTFDVPVPALLATATVTTDHKLEWFGTSRSRLGFLWSPNVLVYGTGGVAYGQLKDSAIINVAGVGTVSASRKDTRAGWTAGGGIEGAFGGGWSAKVEYLYIDLGELEQTVVLPAATQVFSHRFTDNIVRVGLNYKWGTF